jgi:hypothetical protein
MLVARPTRNRIRSFCRRDCAAPARAGCCRISVVVGRVTVGRRCRSGAKGRVGRRVPMCGGCESPSVRFKLRSWVAARVRRRGRRPEGRRPKVTARGSGFDTPSRRVVNTWCGDGPRGRLPHLRLRSTSASTTKAANAATPVGPATVLTLVEVVGATMAKPPEKVVLPNVCPMATGQTLPERSRSQLLIGGTSQHSSRHRKSSPQNATSR